MYQQAAFDYATLPTDAAEDLEATGASVDEVVGGGVNETQASKKQGGSLSPSFSLSLLSTLKQYKHTFSIACCFNFILYILQLERDQDKQPMKGNLLRRRRLKVSNMHMQVRVHVHV